MDCTAGQNLGRFSDDDCPKQKVSEADYQKDSKASPENIEEAMKSMTQKITGKPLSVKKKAKFGFKKPKKITAKQAVLDPTFNKSNFVADLIDEVKRKAFADRQGALVEEIYKRLAALGHVFEGENKEQESKDFFRNRLRIARDKEDNCYVYLDYVDNENRGTLIIWYNSNMIPEVKIEVERNGGATMTVVT